MGFGWVLVGSGLGLVLARFLLDFGKNLVTFLLGSCWALVRVRLRIGYMFAWVSVRSWLDLTRVWLGHGWVLATFLVCFG